MSSVESGVASLVLEGKNGRHISYLSKRDQDVLHRQYAQQQLEEEQRRRDAIEAYQEAVRGPSSPELTAENIRMQPRVCTQPQEQPLFVKGAQW